MRNSRAAQSRNFQSRNSHNLPRNGTSLPRTKYTPDDVAKAQAEVLQICYGPLKSPAKTMARDTGMSERACRNLIAGLNSMNLASFFNACQDIPELRPWGARMMGLAAEHDPSFGQEFERGRQALTVRFEKDGFRMFRGGDPVG